MVSKDSDGPLIGLTTYVEQSRHGVWDELSALLPMTYVSAVIRAGGIPVLLPPSPVAPAAVLGALSGLVVTGGPDVDPALYGAEPHDQTDRPRPDRDAWESGLCRAALEMDLPLLAICRGLQVLNVAQGGTLHQHLPEVTGSEAHRSVRGSMTHNRVRASSGTALSALLGPTASVSCHHHQAIDRLGSGMRATAFAADGTIEGIEVDQCRFALGVQWHPETDDTGDRLFQALVDAALAYREDRSRSHA